MVAEGTPSPPLVGLDAPPPKRASLATDLAHLVGAEHVSSDPGERRRASQDMWPKTFLWERQGRSPPLPDVVVRPGSVDEVAAVVRFARDRAIPLTPYGAGSGVCGGALPVEAGITLRLERLDRVLRIDREALFVEAQAGILGISLEEALRAKGLTLGHFPSSIGCSSLGGWLAARSGGQSSPRYGKIEDMVQQLGCVLGTGAVVRPSRPVSGIDWIELLLGSEGTFGIFTDARLRLWPAPQVELPRGFRFPSLGAGLAAMEAMFRAGLRPSVVRLYDPLDTVLALGPHRGERGDQPSPVRRPPGPGELRPTWSRAALDAPRRFAMDLALSHAGVLNGAASVARACLLVLVHEGGFGEAEPEAAEARAICEAHRGTDLGEGPGRRWLRERYAVSYKLPKVFEAGAWADTCEVATSWGKVEALFDAVRAAVAPHALVMAHFSHAYADGCSIYFTFTGTARRAEQGIVTYDRAWSAALDAAVAAGATITHHHGVGLFKAPWLREEIGEGGFELLRAVKRSCDPSGILNPGKLGLEGQPCAPAVDAADARSRPDAAAANATGACAHHDPSAPGVAGEGWHPAAAGADATVALAHHPHERATDEPPHLDRGRLTSVDRVDERAMWIRAFAGAPVASVEARLRGVGLTLGRQPPSVLRGTVAEWLEGPLAGRRVEDGRLGPGVASIEAALPGGLLFLSRAAPRTAAGPAVAQLFLGGGGEWGSLLAATLKARPLPIRTIEAGVAGPAEAICRFLRLSTQEATPPLEVWITGGDSGELTASVVFDAGSDREEARLGRTFAAARALGLRVVDPQGVGPGFKSDVSPVGQEWERELPAESWPDVLASLSAGARLLLTRIARESAVAVCDDRVGRALEALPVLDRSACDQEVLQP